LSLKKLPTTTGVSAMALPLTLMGFCPVCSRSSTPGVPTYLQTKYLPVGAAPAVGPLTADITMIAPATAVAPAAPSAARRRRLMRGAGSEGENVGSGDSIMESPNFGLCPEMLLLWLSANLRPLIHAFPHSTPGITTVVFRRPLPVVRVSRQVLRRYAHLSSKRMSDCCGFIRSFSCAQ